MADEYVVYVAAPREEPSPEARLRLAELLGLDEGKLDSLLRRLPGEVTKPVPEGTAVTVSRRFREAGLEASIRSAGSTTAGARTRAMTPRATAPGGTGSSGAASPPAEAAALNEPDGDEPSRDEPAAASAAESGSGGSLHSVDQVDGDRFSDEGSPEDGDELFPPSAFAPAKGPKPPSPVLLIAFLVVVVVLALLWFLL